ncbi:serine/threonine protein phosphatase 2A 57 kDa regulatory subunit B' beta isoform-like [Juglans microcarpa x Juglans regia]|uniref:serine/threonine protein phosphatase 2A 57 kDa regulatory subunit B' beta isoform-like n=1 Tax=Juglans microcarpa x Juglans regia TaxID=2249226 RepID=UPI001B7F68B7|nr:serine/threonine protein phosphatase 2A 57 kDa regulatory subunit B' beta isoform-like [Juglans microcarpa x Juglans regia]
MAAQRDSPTASPKKKSATLQYLFDLDSKDEPRRKLAIHFSSSENEEILSIISYCTLIFTFTDPLESPSQQDLKRQKLTQLLSVVKLKKGPLRDQILAPLMSMLSTNLFRPLPPPSNPSSTQDLLDDEDLISTFSPAWSHLQVVYDILLRLVTNTDPEILRDHVDHPFLLNLLSLFQSEDPRERECLKNLYHRIYLRFTFYRSFMRKSMNDVFLHFIFETERHFGIGELLEIWGSIINGFTVPLKEEHKLFLMRVLIPLHKTKGMQAYHRQLAYCVSQFLQKEPVLGGVIVRGILRYWPVTNCQKEVFLIGELEELVENLDPGQYRKLALPMCTQITKCLNSWNSQVAERALYLWNNELFVTMASLAIEEIFPVVVEGMEKNLKWHWSKSVRQLTQNVKTMLEEMDSILYSECLQAIDLRESRAHQEETKRKEKWERIEMAAARNQFNHHVACVSH